MAGVLCGTAADTKPDRQRVLLQMAEPVLVAALLSAALGRQLPRQPLRCSTPACDTWRRSWDSRPARRVF